MANNHVVLVSACLLGQPVRYDGQSKLADLSCLVNKDITLVAICPECAGGLPTPRVPCEIEKGSTAGDILAGQAKVKNADGIDCTQQYVEGSRFCLKIAQQHHACCAILKEKSPDCGTHMVYDGQFNGTLKNGRGITAELLHQNGIKLFNENECEELLAQLEKS